MWTATVCVSFWIQNPADMVVEANPVLGPFFREYGLSFLAGFRIGNLFLVVLPLQDERSHLWPDFPENVLTKFRFSSSSISTEFL